MSETVMSKYRLDGRVIVITGGAGLLGEAHAEAVLEAGGTPALIDIDLLRLEKVKTRLEGKGGKCLIAKASVTDRAELEAALAAFLKAEESVDGLVNNAAINPKVSKTGLENSGRFETFSLEAWQQEINVGLTGAFLCCQVFGNHMATNGKRNGAIVNIASDLAIISPDQRLYVRDGLPHDQQPAKPVTYSVIKTGLLGLTRYLATWWAESGVRVNALSPGGIFQNQSPDFLAKLESRIPMGRMANRDEYKASLVFLCSDASSYITGANLVADGGRTIW